MTVSKNIPYISPRRKLKLQKEFESKTYNDTEIIHIITIQSWYRGCYYRRQRQLEEQAVVQIQALYRGHLARERYKKYKPIWIQQRSIDRKLLTTRNRLAVKERDFRVYSVMSSSRVKSYDKEQQSKAAIKIQQVYRGYRDRKKVRNIILARKKKLEMEANLDRPRWMVADMDDPVKPLAVNHSLKESNELVQELVSDIVTKLILEQQRRASSILAKERRLKEWQQKEANVKDSLDDLVNEEMLLKGPISLRKRIKKASELLDDYYSHDPKLGYLDSYDLSLGCYELRRKTDLYMKALEDGFNHPDHALARYPIPSDLMMKAKQQHSKIKKRLQYPWWSRNIQDDEEWAQVVQDVDEQSERFY